MTKFKKRLILFSCVVALLVVAGFNSTDKYEDKVKKIITELGGKLAADPEIPGLSIAVLTQGADEPVCAAFGTACIGNSIPMTPEEKIKIGSVTKVFTASLIHRFIEQGKISYDTTIDRFFPNLPYGKRVTIKNLLYHTSGIVDMLSLKPVRENMGTYRTPEELIAMVAKKPLLFKPGTAQQYCNTNYLMLAVITEKLSGMSYHDQVNDVLCDELGMKNLLVGNDTAIVDKLSCGYTNAPGGGLQLPMMASLGISLGTGNIEGPPEDVVRLVNLNRVLKDNVLDTQKLEPITLSTGKKAQFSSMVVDSNCTESYLNGCTLFMFDKPEIKVIGKLGSFPGFGTVYYYDQQTKTAVAISVNNEEGLIKAMLLGAEILNELRN